MRWHHDAMDLNLGKFWEMVRDREAGCAVDHRVTKSWTQLGTILYKTKNKLEE